MLQRKVRHDRKAESLRGMQNGLTLDRTLRKCRPKKRCVSKEVKKKRKGRSCHVLGQLAAGWVTGMLIRGRECPSSHESGGAEKSGFSVKIDRRDVSQE